MQEFVTIPVVRHIYLDDTSERKSITIYRGDGVRLIDLSELSVNARKTVRFSDQCQRDFSTQVRAYDLRVLWVDFIQAYMSIAFPDGPPPAEMRWEEFGTSFFEIKVSAVRPRYEDESWLDGYELGIYRFNNRTSRLNIPMTEHQKAFGKRNHAIRKWIEQWTPFPHDPQRLGSVLYSVEEAIRPVHGSVQRQSNDNFLLSGARADNATSAGPGLVAVLRITKKIFRSRKVIPQMNPTIPSMQPLAHRDLPAETWLQVMVHCDYKDICVLRMCSRAFVMLAQSCALDKIMFRCGVGSVAVTSKPRLHPALKGLFFSRCLCHSRKLVLKTFPGGFPSVGPLMYCPHHPSRSGIDSGRAYTPRLPRHEPKKDTIPLDSPVMTEYFTEPSLQRIYVEFGADVHEIAWEMSFIFEETGITVGQIYRAILRILRKTEEDSREPFDMHHRLQLHNESWEEGYEWVLAYTPDDEAALEPFEDDNEKEN